MIPVRSWSVYHRFGRPKCGHLGSLAECYFWKNISFNSSQMFLVTSVGILVSLQGRLLTLSSSLFGIFLVV